MTMNMSDEDKKVLDNASKMNNMAGSGAEAEVSPAAFSIKDSEGMYTKLKPISPIKSIAQEPNSNVDMANVPTQEVNYDDLAGEPLTNEQRAEDDRIRADMRADSFRSRDVVGTSHTGPQKAVIESKQTHLSSGGNRAIRRTKVGV